jgi:myo-inositol 2-dehydrogenase/D-chiro-inositol 1-dehydrogenase
MTVRVGVIGVGMIGQDHIRRITQVLSGGVIVAVTDVDPARARQAASGLPGATIHPTGRDLIADRDVDAVLVTSWGPTHEEHVLAAIEAGKPVFCEKPLATTAGAARRIVDAEMAGGRRLVQVGFMRRYDPGYHALKAALEDGRIGAPLMMHCAHRNPAAPPYGFTTEMIISDSAVHELDLVRWMFGEDIVAANVLRPRRTGKAGPGLHDPLIVLLEMASGILVDVEVFLNATYGYDIRGEIVGETGTVALADGGGDGADVTQDGVRSRRVPASWQERFGRAFDAEFQDWLSAVAAGTSAGPAGPSAWDGYAAAVATESCLEALRTGQRTAVTVPEQPGFYAKAPCPGKPGEAA